MQSVEKQGKTVEEAIMLALEDLGTTLEQVESEVIEEPSKGFLGILGGRPARVRVTLKPDALSLLEEFVQGVCERMGSSINVEVSANDDGVKVDLGGQNLGLLIGKHGQTLDSLQYLANVVYNRNTDSRQRVVVDAGGYRERREETLLRLATRLADKAKRTGRRVMLEPMSAHERRIIHTALQNDSQIVTYSEGEEPYRKVVISLK
ncbi:MAG TPA: protein jag [Firmicutes bacterium]|jgi:spoIIIJ-associated protein|nr:protein jag [Bacillota bacterium]